MGRMDEMSARMSELEHSIANIMENAGVESASSAKAIKDNSNNNNAAAAAAATSATKSEPVTMEI